MTSELFSQDIEVVSALYLGGSRTCALTPLILYEESGRVFLARPIGQKCGRVF